MKIYKYVLGEDTTLKLPYGSVVLTVAAQGDDICIWISVHTAASPVKRRFKTVPTGDRTPEGLYVGTSFLYASRLVFHTFEVHVTEDAS